jgi:hypothetical protein
MKHLLLYLTLIIGFNAIGQEIDHSKWNQILQTFVDDSGCVDYDNLDKNPELLDDYLNDLEHNGPEQDWSLEAKMAFWINAYNAYTIKLILNHYPISSIKSITKPWDQKFITIDNNTISLNTIEHKILRPMKDPRIHFAIVCASKSCPSLSTTAYSETNLEKELEHAAKRFINDPEKNHIDNNTIKLSKIFKWFRSDFTENGSLIDFLNSYSNSPLTSNIKIKYLEYDWALNANP